MVNNFDSNQAQNKPRDSTAFLSDKSNDSDPGFNIVEAEDIDDNPETPSIGQSQGREQESNSNFSSPPPKSRNTGQSPDRIQRQQEQKTFSFEKLEIPNKSCSDSNSDQNNELSAAEIGSEMTQVRHRQVQTLAKILFCIAQSRGKRPQKAQPPQVNNPFKNFKRSNSFTMVNPTECNSPELSDKQPISIEYLEQKLKKDLLNENSSETDRSSIADHLGQKMNKSKSVGSQKPLSNNAKQFVQEYFVYAKSTKHATGVATSTLAEKWTVILSGVEELSQADQESLNEQEEKKSSKRRQSLNVAGFSLQTHIIQEYAAPDHEKIRKDQVEYVCNSVTQQSNELPTSNLLDKGAHMYRTSLHMDFNHDWANSISSSMVKTIIMPTTNVYQTGRIHIKIDYISEKDIRTQLETQAQLAQQAQRYQRPMPDQNEQVQPSRPRANIPAFAAIGANVPPFMAALGAGSPGPVCGRERLNTEPVEQLNTERCRRTVGLLNQDPNSTENHQQQNSINQRNLNLGAMTGSQNPSIKSIDRESQGSANPIKNLWFKSKRALSGFLSGSNSNANVEARSNAGSSNAQNADELFQMQKARNNTTPQTQSRYQLPFVNLAANSPKISQGSSKNQRVSEEHQDTMKRNENQEKYGPGLLKHSSALVQQEQPKNTGQTGQIIGIKHSQSMQTVNSSDDVSDNLTKRKCSFEYSPSAITSEAKRSYRFFSTDDQGNKIEVLEDPPSIMETSDDSDSEDQFEITGLDSPVNKKNTDEFSQLVQKFSYLIDEEEDSKKDLKFMMASAGNMDHLKSYSGARKLTASTKDGSSNEDDQLEAFHKEIKSMRKLVTTVRTKACAKPKKLTENNSPYKRDLLKESGSIVHVMDKKQAKNLMFQDKMHEAFISVLKVRRAVVKSFPSQVQ